MSKDLVLSVLDSEVDLSLKKKFEQAKEEHGSFDSFLREFLMSFISPQTQRAYLKDLWDFFGFLKKGGQHIAQPSDIKGIHFSIYRDHLLEKKYSSATINRKLVAIRSFIKWALAKRLIDHNPLDVIKLPKIQTESPTLAFDDHEVLAMINAPDLSKPKGNMHRLMMVMLFSLGLRRSELVNLKLKDIYADRGHEVLRIKGKGSKERHLPLTDELKKEINDYLEVLTQNDLSLTEEDYLLQTLQGKRKNTKPIDGSTIYRVIQKYALVCDIKKKVSPHSCRATVISHLLDTHQTPIRDVAIFSGHAKITTTERYDKRRKGLDDSAAYQVNYKKSS